VMKQQQAQNLLLIMQLLNVNVIILSGKVSVLAP